MNPIDFGSSVARGGPWAFQFNSIEVHLAILFFREEGLKRHLFVIEGHTTFLRPFIWYAPPLSGTHFRPGLHMKPTKDDGSHSYPPNFGRTKPGRVGAKRFDLICKMPKVLCMINESTAECVFYEVLHLSVAQGYGAEIRLGVQYHYDQRRTSALYVRSGGRYC